MLHNVYLPEVVKGSGSNLSSDGPQPKAPPANNTSGDIVAFWHNQNTLVDGLAQETCRDGQAR